MTDKKKATTAGKIDLRDIRLTAGGDPLPIDPDTGKIDVTKLTAAQKAEIEAAAERIQEAVKKAIPVTNIILEHSRKASEALKKATGFMHSNEWRDLLQEIRDNIQPMQELIDEIDELEPFIKAELKKDEYNGMAFDDIMQHTPGELLELRNDPNSTIYKVIEAARAAKEKAERVIIQHTDDIEYPLDKISGKAWNLFTENTNGQLSIAFDMLPKKQNLRATAYYSINFDNLGDNVKITKRLQPFDKRVYIAVSALFNAGNDIITATQVYYAMGNTGKPSTNQIEKIDAALSKMTGAKITLDNAQEAEATKGKYPHFKYDGSLLPIEKITAIVNGQVSESAIHIFREPPLMTFAKERKQVTTIDVALLQSPVSKTDANLLIDDYLIDRISKAKNGKGNSCRILYKTLYEHADIKTRNQRTRAPEKIDKYLSYYQQQGFIKRYETDKDGITVFV